MKFHLISDNIDTIVGMRLAGITGVLVHEDEEVKKALTDAMAREDVAVILMTEKLVKLCPDLVYDLKLNRQPGSPIDCRNPRPPWKRADQGFHYQICPGCDRRKNIMRMGVA